MPSNISWYSSWYLPPHANNSDLHGCSAKHFNEAACQQGVTDSVILSSRILCWGQPQVDLAVACTRLQLNMPLHCLQEPKTWSALEEAPAATGMRGAAAITLEQTQIWLAAAFLSLPAECRRLSLSLQRVGAAAAVSGRGSRADRRRCQL